MINVENLNKYYFKGEARELHVINNVTLALPDHGLITFLGASGSGKTTLLNVIGGLDKANNGKIHYPDKRFDKYDMDAMDIYRKNNFGYVFQNYLLLPNKTVIQNLTEALEIIGVYDKAEQKKRIEYTLSKVNLYKFRNKLVRTLSGGQMQRVSIARALLKNAKVIIADEPTGNIDSENTLEVMNILKHISETSLVLLVTHEEDIAYTYSDRIIEIKDGQVIRDIENNGKDITYQITDKKIYLKDYEKESFNKNDFQIELYASDIQNLQDVGLKLVIKNDTVYISSNKKIVNVTESSIDFVDDHQENSFKRITEDFNFDTSWYKEEEEPKKSTIFFRNIKNAFKQYRQMPKKKRMFQVIYGFLGLIFAIATIGVSKFDGSDVTGSYPTNDYYCVQTPNSSEVIYTTPIMDAKILKEAYEDQIIAGFIDLMSDSATFVYETNYAVSKYISYYASKLYYKDSVKLLYGEKPVLSQDRVITKAIADTLISELGGGLTYQDLIGLSSSGYYGNKAVIVGIAEGDGELVYVDRLNNEMRSQYSFEETNIYPQAAVHYEIVEGNKPTNNNEIIVSSAAKEKYNLHLNDQLQISMKDVKIVGFFNSAVKNAEILSYQSLKDTFGSKAYLAYDFTRKQTFAYTYDTRTLYLNAPAYVLVSGKAPTNSNEILINQFDERDYDEITDYGMLKVVGIYLPLYDNGFFDSSRDYRTTVISTNVSDRIYGEEIISQCFEIFNEDEARTYFENKSSTLYSMNEYTYKLAKNDYYSSATVIYSMIVVLILIVILYSYFTSRSLMIADIYAIGVYRSLGKTRKSIIREYRDYGLVQTTLSCAIGYLIVFVVYTYIEIKVSTITKSSYNFQFGYFILGLIFLYLINVVAGILPISSLTRKTPSEINSKYDI